MATDPATGLQTGLTPQQFQSTYNLPIGQAVKTGVLTPQQAQQDYPGYQGLHPAVAQAATTPGVSLTPAQINQLQGLKGLPSGIGGVGSVVPPGAQTGIGYGMYQTPPPPTPPTSQQTSQAQQAQQKKQQALRVESMKQEFSTIVSGLTPAQVSGPQAQATAIWLARIASSLPYADAQSLLGKLPQNSTLSGLVQQYITNPQAANAAGQGAAKPTYDPLALQTMWHDVFGPIFDQTSKMAGSAGQDYMTAMNNSIAGSNLPANQQAQLKAQSGATGALLQQLASQQTKSVATQPAYDQMIAALQQASGAAQLAQGEYEKQIAYGQAAPFLGGSSGATGATGGININALLGGGAAGTGAVPAAGGTAANPLYPNLP